MNEALELVARKELEALGYDLVELRRGGTKSRQLIELRIDRVTGEKVTVDDCVRASRAVEARLDALPEFADGRYVLEVSSPGVDRRLVRPQDWARFVGRKASVKSAALGGRVEVEIIGVEGTDSAPLVCVRDAAGVEHRVLLSDVAEARLTVHWK